MELSHENLNKLKTWEYKKYKLMLLRLSWFRNIYITLFSLLSISVSLLLLFYIFNWVDKEFSGCIVALLFYSYLFFLGFLVEVNNYIFPFNYLLGKTKFYNKMKELEQRFLPIEKEVEKEIKNYINYNLRTLIKELGKNSSNPQIYASLIQIFQKNHNFIEESLLTTSSLFSLNAKYKNTLKNQNIWFEKDLVEIKIEKDIIEPVKKTIFSNLRNKFQNTIKSNRKSSTYSINPLGNARTEVKKTITEPTIEKQSVKINKENDKFVFQDSFLNNVAEIPSKKKRVVRPRIIKASDDFWENLGKKRIETGRRGEMLVMEYERNRITSDEGEGFLNKLHYSALVDGDGLGYDITSVYDGQEIYIEVKTTVGSFWSGLYFTHNELNTMKSLKEKYYLYRIYEFDKKTNSGKLKIYKGCEEIINHFDFSPQTYILQPKN